MNVIIAVVPAPGHEGLVAKSAPDVLPECATHYFPEQPAVIEVLRDGRIQHALVLHAPGDPRLGMVRLMEALFGDDALGAIVRFDPGIAQGWLAERDGDTLADWDVPEPPPGAGVPAYALAHLAVQRGIASEVLVLP